MTKSRWAILSILVVGSLVVFAVIQPRLSTVEMDEIEKLPAVIRLREGSDGKSIVAIRLLPSASRRFDDLKCLANPSVLTHLEAFDAVDCKDFADDGLKLLSHASHLEFVSLDGTSISDESLKLLIDKFPSAKYLGIENCPVTEQAIIDLLAARQLQFIRLSDTYDKVKLRKRIGDVSPRTIVMVAGQDIMEQPEFVFDLLPWDKW